MTEFLSRFDAPRLIALVSIVGGLMIATITIVAVFWHKIRQTELKKDMVNRGMSADEIKTVLEADSKK